MAILEQIMNMKKQGIPDQEIVNELSQKGISPKQINDALKQAQIKNAVSNNSEEGLQPSIMPGGESAPSPPANNNQEYQPQTYQAQAQYAPAPQEEYQPQEYQEQEQYAPGQGYEQQYPQTGIDTDTVMEIADQIVSEKIKKIQKQTDTLTESSSLLKTKVDNVSERLKRIETTIDKLQIAILGKIGSYGDNLNDIKKEMSMMQNSFSKMISSPKEHKETKPEPYPEKEFAEPEKIKSQRKTSKKK